MADITLNIGEALVGEGNEIAHIDLLIGDKDGPGRRRRSPTPWPTSRHGHSNLLAVLTPNLLCKPATVLITKVTIKGMKQAVQMFGPAQDAVAKAVADCVADGIIPKAEAENLVIVCGVFIHSEAEDNAKIYQYNYEATKLSIQRAMKSEPKIERDHRQEGHGQAPVLAEVTDVSVSRDGDHRPGTDHEDDLMPDAPAQAHDPAPARHRPAAQRLRRRRGRRRRASSTCSATAASRPRRSATSSTAPSSPAGPADLRRRRSSSAARDVAKAEAVLEAVKSTFFGPFRVSVLFDPNGSNTTAAAAVLAVLDGLRGKVEGERHCRARRHRPGGRPCRAAARGARGERGPRLARPRAGAGRGVDGSGRTRRGLRDGRRGLAEGGPARRLGDRGRGRGRRDAPAPLGPLVAVRRAGPDRPERRAAGGHRGRRAGRQAGRPRRGARAGARSAWAGRR